MTALPGRIGRYRVEAVLGSGGFSTVYRARDERLDAPVAVKVLAENRSLDADVRERFVTEGHLLRRISGPHLVAVHDIGETERQQPFLVLDLADRGDLAARRARVRAAGQAPSLDDVLLVARFLADALEAVHACHVVHRDLSPANLLVRSRPRPALATGTTAEHTPAAAFVAADEQLVLSDLGLSKDLARHSGLTVGGGTSGFTPPEQRTDGGRVDARADLWAASAVLVWVLLGRAPDDGGSWRRELGKHAPVRLVRALERGLARDPDARPDDAGTWLRTVEDAVRPPPPPPRPTATGRARQRVAAGALALLLAGAAGGSLATTLAVQGDATQVRDVGAGRVRATSADGRVAVSGPSVVAVGERAVFDARLDSVDRWVWTAPDGAVYPDAPTLAVEAASAGTATVRLLGVGADGTVVEVALPFTVVGPP